MGSGTSRGKRVAPACVSEIDVPKRDGKLESHYSFRSLKIPNFVKVTNNNNNAQQTDRHSEGCGSESSAEEDGDITAVASHRVLTHYDEDFAQRKSIPRKSYIRAKTYGLCNFRRVHVDVGDFNSSRHVLPTTESCEEPRGPDADVNKKSNGLLSNFKKHSTPAFQNGSLTKGVCCLESSLPISEKHSSLHNSLTVPVGILFDGSEEELMDTIEREFS